MAEALVSVLIQQLSSILADKVNEVKLVVGVKEELENLRSNLRKIRDVVADAEETQLKNKAVERWLDDLKDVAYDMEDVLDKWNTALLKFQIEGRHSHDSASTTSKRRPSSCLLEVVLGVDLLGDIDKKIKDLNETLNYLTAETKASDFKVGKGKAQQPQPRRTTPVFDATEVRSRKEETDMIKNLLLSEGSQSSAMNIISIVGIGGIGKTTLARLLFNDDDVRAHFNQNIWVCVSKPFEFTRIARDILESLICYPQEFVGLQAVMTGIAEAVREKRFLLVLDDVWGDGPEKLQELKDSLFGGSHGSTILVTTRSQNVAISMGSNNLFHVGKLSLDECWSIFRQNAYFDTGNKKRKLLETIGREIVMKGDGLPLAAKVLGSLLRFKSSLQEWREVLSSELWELPEIWESDMGLDSLWLSYYDLPSEMRQSFSYCAIFPEDYTIEKSSLIAMWMAQGYLGTTSMEKCGEEHFQSLASRCFFQQFDNLFPYYKMNNVLRKLAQYIRREECCSIGISEELTELPVLPIKTRHLRLGLGEEASLPSSIFKLEKLRTFWLESNGNRITQATLYSLFDKLICLRFLILRECGIEEIPASIRKLVHLRQLDLSRNYGLRKLHENVCELCNLQTLDVSDCLNLDLPKRMERLINLRHLHNSGCYSVTPKGVSRLSNLRTLRQLVIDSGVNEANCSIGDLKHLKNLEGALKIMILGNVEEPKEPQLNTMDQIIDLWLEFGVSEEREEKKHHHEQLIEVLGPSRNVKILCIEGYQGTKFIPNWLMSLNNLTELRLECENCEYLPSLWKLPMLEKLYLEYMKGVKRLGGGFVGMESGKNVGDEVSESSSMVATMAFPKLKILMFRCADEWEEWKSVKVYSNLAIMPCLTSLHLYGCWKLKALPNYIYQSETLKGLTLHHCLMIDEQQIREQKKWANPNLVIDYQSTQLYEY